MRRTKRLIITITATLMVMLAAQIQVAGVVAAEVANAPSLVISQLKVTSSNGQFITLYNATNTSLDMGKFQLEYFNNYDLAKATSSKLISLTGTVPPHGYFRVNDDSLLLCFQQTVDSVSLDLSSTAGLIEVLAYNQTLPGESATPILQDFLGWSKTVAAGAQTLPSNTAAFLNRQPVDTLNNPQVIAPGVGSWQVVQPSSTDPCNLVTINNTAAQTGPSQLLSAIEPAATITDQSDDSIASTSAALPASDVGLMSPMLTEILPNPVGTGNDSTNEFIELYNPNPTNFDLSSFELQAGTTSLHTYTFAAGTNLPPLSFAAYYSSATGLSLSNSGGQVKLLDPLGNVLSSTAAYNTAADGQAWALANGKWYWTTKPTPGAPNVIIKPAAKTKKSSSKTTTKKSAAKAKSTKTKKSKTALANSSSDSPPSTSPIHAGVLAAVAGLALLYGVYEYRADLANRFHRLKPNPAAGQKDRPATQGGRGHRFDWRPWRWQNYFRKGVSGRAGQPGTSS